MSIAHYLPSPTQIAGLLAVLGVALVFVTLGAVAGRRRLGAADLVTGWGMVAALFTLVGVGSTLPFRFLAIALFAGAALVGAWAAYRRDRRLAAGDAATMIGLGAPLLLVASAMMASQWDEFSQWLWSARYLMEVVAFPRAGLPENPASFPGYPYGLPLAMYLAGRLVGGFIENSGILFNVVLLLAFALLLARLIAIGLEREDGAPTGVGLGALGLLAAFAFPPFVVPKIAFTTYAEVGTAVAVAFGGVLGWLILQAVAGGDHGRARVLTLQFSLAMVFLVAFKQVNLVLFGLLAAGVALAGLRMPGVAIGRLAGLLIPAAAPPLAVYLLWRYHVAVELPGREFAVMPLAEWSLASLPKTLATMLGIALRKSGHFALMLGIAAWAINGLARYRGPFDALAIVAGTVFIGYNGFLLFAYVAIFGAWEAERAVSFWRYNMHLGALAGAVLVHGLALLWRRYGADRSWGAAAGRLRWLAVALVLAAPLAFAPKVRFDLHAPKVHVREIGAELKTLLAPGATLALIDPLDTGFYVKLIQYELYRAVPVVVHHHIHGPQRDLGERLAEAKPSHAWVHTQDDRVRAVFGLEMPSGASYLLAATAQGWTVVKTWPYPGYRLPTEVPD